MPEILHANNAYGFLNAGITAAATTLVLQAGQGARFPALSVGQQFWLTLEDRSSGALEIVLVTARTADSMTVVRGQQGTTAKAFNAGTSASNRVTAAWFNTLESRIVTAETLSTAASSTAAAAAAAAADAEAAADAVATQLSTIEATANAANAAATQAQTDATAALTAATNAEGSIQDAIDEAAAATAAAQAATTAANAVSATADQAAQDAADALSTANAVSSQLANKADIAHNHDSATTSAAGFMSSNDKIKLDGIAAGATQNQSDAHLLNLANATGTLELTKLAQTGAVLGQGIVWTAGGWAPGNVASEGGGGTMSAAQIRDALVTLTGADRLPASAIEGLPVTNLTYDAATRLLSSSTGAGVNLPLAVRSGNAGLMTGNDKRRVERRPVAIASDYSFFTGTPLDRGDLHEVTAVTAATIQNLPPGSQPGLVIPFGRGDGTAPGSYGLSYWYLVQSGSSGTAIYFATQDTDDGSWGPPGEEWQAIVRQSDLVNAVLSAFGVPDQATVEAGTSTVAGLWTPERDWQSIAAWIEENAVPPDAVPAASIWQGLAVSPNVVELLAAEAVQARPFASSFNFDGHLGFNQSVTVTGNMTVARSNLKTRWYTLEVTADATPRTVTVTTGAGSLVVSLAANQTKVISLRGTRAVEGGVVVQ